MALDSGDPHCHTPGRLACAQRNAYSGRARSDAEFGRRNTGLPQGNLADVKVGARTHPLTDTQLEEIASYIAQNLFDAQLETYLNGYPAERRKLQQIQILEEVKNCDPFLKFLRLLWIIEEAADTTVTGQSRS